MHTIIELFESIQNKIINLQKQHFPDCECICCYGDIIYGILLEWQKQFEKIKKSKNEKLLIILHTGGGSVTIVEKLVSITRRFFKEVYFLIPEQAMSAGTIWVMSGDKIYMSYLSSLGPIDPQVPSSDGRKLLPALGFLDKFREISDKSLHNQASPVELMMINNLSIADLSLYEQNLALSIDLLKEWLTKYKFKNWSKTTSQKKDVTNEMKQERANQIAIQLNNTHQLWHSHGRYLSIETLEKVLKLQIDDFSDNDLLFEHVNSLHRSMIELQNKLPYPLLIIAAKS